MSPISHSLMARTIEIVPHHGTAPFTTPLLTSNLVFRVFLAFLANLVCLVPLKNLCRNGEFAAAVFVTTVIFFNTDTIVNSLIWRDDNIEKWWRGWIWCDVHPYVYQPSLTIYATSVVAIMRNLAEQVNFLRVGPLPVVEKRKRMWLQALIIFPLPIVQLGWVYPLSGQRYTIGTLRGCIWATTPNWVCVVFFLLPLPIISLVAGFYSVLTWRRYTQIERSTRSAVMSNSSAAARSNRTRRRLFCMTACILVPYTPVTCITAVLQMKAYYPWEGYDFGKIHHENGRLPWNSIILLTHDHLSFFELNSIYLPILTAVAVFVFFGLTQDTKDTYRHCLLVVRLDKAFPGLRAVQNPGGHLMTAVSQGSLSVATPAKLDEDGVGRAVHVSQASKIPGSLSSLPSPNSINISNATKKNLNITSNDLGIAPKEAEHCAPYPCTGLIADYDEGVTPSAAPKNYLLDGQPASKTSPFSSRNQYGIHGFSGKDPMVSPTVKSRRVHARSGSDGHNEAFNQRTHQSWLPQLSPQPELIEMIQAQMVRSGGHDREPID